MRYTVKNLHYLCSKHSNMEENNPIVRINSVDDYNRLFGFETLHPLVSVVDFSTNAKILEKSRFLYGVYALFLKHGEQCVMHYGRRKYDYTDGSIVSFAPGQAVDVEMRKDVPASGAIGLLFHPDLIYGTTLGRHINEYHFFDYDSAESLHLSQREQQLYKDTLNSIQFELEQAIDKHSQTIIVDRIKLLLDYCQRFYDRQFITRHKENSDIIASFERNINEYFQSGAAKMNGMPQVGYFAEKAFLSAGYFGDLIKKETGQTAKQLIQQKIITLSKQMLLDNRYTINQVADELGFQYPQHFSRFFKQQVGMSPKEYKLG